MSKEAIKYLRENKDKYSHEQLINSLRENNYPEKDIEDSLGEVYKSTGQTKNRKRIYTLLDFRNKKRYFSVKEKAIDFLLGIFIPVITIVIFSFAFRLLGFLASLIAVILLSILVFIRRRWIFYGIITWFSVVIIVFFIILYIIFNSFNIY